MSKVTLLALVMIFFSSLTFAKTISPDTIKIKTSAKCGSCKTRIEKALTGEAGVLSAVVNVDTKVCTVIYNRNLTTSDKIRQAISKVGYDADNVKADPAAYKKLPGCCQKDGKE